MPRVLRVPGAADTGREPRGRAALSPLPWGAACAGVGAERLRPATAPAASLKVTPAAPPPAPSRGELAG